ncbi:MAG: glutaredoxin family protein [Myxococcales bacterium]|nr:glutaredoxin family protein [Myxococcales bacterium]
MRAILSTTLVEVYTRPSCSLCADALELLHAARRAWGFELVERDIFEREEWFSRYRHQVPVVAVGGIDRLSLKFSQQELEVALAAALEEVRARE